MSRILYKYLDINGGKAMMGLLESRCIFRKKKCHPTLQFTNATQLNDPFDCHPKLIDYSNVPDEITHSIFTKEWWQKKVENDAHDDMQAVNNLFTQVARVIETINETYGYRPQIIISEHADNLNMDGFEFNSFVRARWRKSNEGLMNVDKINASKQEQNQPE